MNVSGLLNIISFIKLSFRKAGYWRKSVLYNE